MRKRDLAQTMISEGRACVHIQLPRQLSARASRRTQATNLAFMFQQLHGLPQILAGDIVDVLAEHLFVS